MSLDELSVGERTCSNCGSYSCQGLLVAFAGKQAKDCASWNESSASVRVRAEKRIAELEALVSHPGDGSCDKCGAAPAVHVPMSLCRECYGTEKRIARLEERLSHAIEVIVAHHTRGHPTACICGMCLCVCDLRSALKEGE